MPIYAYRCASCGHAKDVLQKVSDPLLSVCPACGAATFQKQLTAAGFQLKGSGWYVTDFRGGNNAAKPDAKPADAKPEGDKPADTTSAPAAPAEPAASSSSSSSDGGTASGGCGSACACH
jgi:putative FmdB family regulatory protein